MAGPYKTHAEALDLVDRARTVADKLDPRAWFCAWGTASVDEKDYSAPGVLNLYLGGA